MCEREREKKRVKEHPRSSFVGSHTSYDQERERQRDRERAREREKERESENESERGKRESQRDKERENVSVRERERPEVEFCLGLPHQLSHQRHQPRERLSSAIKPHLTRIVETSIRRDLGNCYGLHRCGPLAVPTSISASLYRALSLLAPTPAQSSAAPALAAPVTSHPNFTSFGWLKYLPVPIVGTERISTVCAGGE